MKVVSEPVGRKGCRRGAMEIREFGFLNFVI
jgi:hypothetical protein